MAERRALVIVGGEVQELSDVDTLIGASGGGSVPTYVAAGKSFKVPADTQALFTEEIELDGDLDLDGVLVEVS